MKTLDATKSDLEKDLDAREKSLAEMREKLKEQETATAAAKELVEKRDKTLLTMQELLKERGNTLNETREKLARLQKENDERDKELTSATRILDTMREEQKKLTTKVDRLQAAAENRFEGIALTGRRVIFLVDMSGSMELVDENTLAPSKWAGVRESVARIMKSLPDLEKFQIIVFSDKPTFLFGRDEGWHNYEGKDSIDRVTRLLSDIKPKGGTNMYAAMDAAFRYRAAGLDTIYLLSDGLPNLGEGATAEQERTLKETELGEILGKYIRRKLKTDWNKPARDKSRVRINAVGFFYESPDVGAFLWALARENEGSFVGMSKP
jgi:Mg-chelatase subunit ChlD